MPKDTTISTPKRKAPYPKKKAPPREKDDRNHVSVNELKRRIRDVKRLLNKPDLPADVRIVQERALSGYEKELADEEKRRERSKMIKKYHFVRFLDRKTATKELNRLTKKQEALANSTDIDSETKAKKLEKLAARIHVARVNLNYTIYYPLMEKYISIYAELKKKKDESAEQQEPEEEVVIASSKAAERTAMWAVVEKCMEEGTLDLLREGKLEGKGEKKEEDGRTETSRPVSSKKDKGNKKAGKKEKDDDDKPMAKPGKNDARKGKAKHNPPQIVEEEDDSDGGFFEM
ncbi:hypothetical protein BJX61DRAFT_266826 [Aspergillus egyptiacus]|nr:hypothetical protein BJX61DRAFT_266826 [Aspergillus egyptiacus]